MQLCGTTSCFQYFGRLSQYSVFEIVTIGIGTMACFQYFGKIVFRHARARSRYLVFRFVTFRDVVPRLKLRHFDFSGLCVFAESAESIHGLSHVVYPRPPGSADSAGMFSFV